MHTLSLLAYNIGIRFYGLAIYIASFFSNKAKLWVEGRKMPIPTIGTAGGNRTWFHCASLGEFEQARPVIEALKQKNPQDQVILTFFSPSGYEIRKNYAFADLVLYLPLDTPGNAAHFLDVIKPDIAVFVKYEFWYNYLAELNKRRIPSLLFSAIFRREQIFFKWYGGLFKTMLGMFNTILVQNEESKSLLHNISIKSQVVSDTRFDRVFQIAQQRKAFPQVETFKAGFKVFIAGSTWKKDDELIVKMINEQVLQGYKYIIAPHDIDDGKLLATEQSLSHPVVTRLSALNEQNTLATQVILVDSIGQLAALYAYSDITYVGGGFNASVHNVLEPAVYGMPLIFGPNHHKSAEAIDLLHQKAGFTVTDYDSFKSTISRLATTESEWDTAQKASKEYVNNRLGGTEKVVAALHKLNT